MKVSDLAKELNITSDVVLKALRSMKLKAVDNKQELSSAVVSVLKSEFKKTKKVEPKKEAVKESKEVKTEAKLSVSKVKKTPSKEAAKSKTTSKAKVIKKEEKKEVKGKKEDAKPISKVKETTVEAKARDAEKNEIERKRLADKEALLSRIKISHEPVFTLKPLARKKRRGGPDLHPSQPLKDISSGSQPSMVEPARAGNVEPEAKEAVVEEHKFGFDKSLPTLEIQVPITVKDFSIKVQQKPSVILKQLMGMGIFANINQGLDGDIVEKLAHDFGFNLTKVRTQEEQVIEKHKEEDEDPKLLKHRPPVVTIMGHVDHGKTSLLDRIRKSKVADSEHGGITQHIGAYWVNLEKGKITFLDTPGHEAFTAMRARGAHITDLVVLVVAADEGIMPQTLEAINHARAANVPIVVAINKIDSRNANIDRVKKQLQEIGLGSEDWGGKTVTVGVSAVTGEGVDNLLELLLLEAELLELKANPDKKASGIVVEAHLSKGKGVMATVIVQSGTLKEGDFVVVSSMYGKVKAMFDDRMRNIQEATPAMPVEILGLPSVPEAGDEFYVVADEKIARDISFKRQEQFKSERMKVSSKISLEDLYAQIQKGEIKELNVVIKSDVQGSLEALKDSLGKIPNDKVKLRFIHTAVGDVNASDVLLALASKAIIIAFHVAIDVRAKQELEKHPVDVRQYRIIYDAVDDIKNALEGLLDAKAKKKFLSRIEVRQVFKLSRSGVIAGCYVLKGKVHRKAKIDVVRAEAVIYTGSISSLKRFKDDVRDVNEGMECGIGIEGFDKYEPGDIFEAYDLEMIAQKL